MSNEIKQRLANLQEDYSERGFDAFDDLRKEDPETYAMVLDEACCQIEDEEEPDEPKQVIQLTRKKGESDARALARLSTTPEFLAMQSINELTVHSNQCLSLDDLTRELEAQSEALMQGDSSRAEAMLNAQSHTLDAMFHNLTRRALLNIGRGYSETGREYIKLAMKAQNQCRSTLDSLTAMKRPLIKQTNIAHGHQQVNNIENSPSRLLGEKQHVDGGTPEETIRTNPHLETVATCYRTTHKSGQE